MKPIEKSFCDMMTKEYGVKFVDCKNYSEVKTKRPMKRPEDTLHKQMNQYLSILQNQKRIDHFTYNASGELRTKTTGALLKAKGLKKGLPDYTVRKTTDNVGFTLHLEAKAGNNKQTAEQKEFQATTIESCNEMYSVVHNIEEVENSIKIFLNVLIPVFFENMRTGFERKGIGKGIGKEKEDEKEDKKESGKGIG
jgi:hypothetical protein